MFTGWLAFNGGDNMGSKLVVGKTGRPSMIEMKRTYYWLGKKERIDNKRYKDSLKNTCDADKIFDKIFSKYK